MKRLSGVLLVVVVVGCGANENADDPGVAADGGPVVKSQLDSESAESATPSDDVPKTEKSVGPAERPSSDPMTVLKKLEARLERNKQGEITSVDLGNSKVSDADLMHLKALANLQVLHLFNTQIGDAGLSHLQGMTGLQELSLGRTQVTDAGLVHLKGLTSLQTLDFSWCTGITGTGMKHFAGMTSLSDLSLYKTRVTDKTAEHLKSVPSLENLMLPDRGTSTDGVKALKKVLTKCEINRLDY